MPTVVELSELEACVLGLLWSDGPCTAYAVRKVFGRSLSPHWSGSAGAIYPLFRRLEERGLIKYKERARGSRTTREFSVTARGLKRLRAWLEPPVPDWAVGVPVDPLRTRLRFLAALAPGKRVSLLGDLKRRLKSHRRKVEEDCLLKKDEGDAYSYAMARGALYMICARYEWVVEVSDSLIDNGK